MVSQSRGIQVISLCCWLILKYTAHKWVSAEPTVISIHWNSSNPLFTKSSDSLLYTVKLQDKVDLICPYYKRETLPENLETSFLYMVDRESYELCSVKANALLAGLCIRPYNQQTVTVVFRRITPNPGGLEFQPGRRYYLISTSGGPMKELQNKDGGLCSKKNMRVQFDVREENWNSNENGAQEERTNLMGNLNSLNRLEPPVANQNALVKQVKEWRTPDAQDEENEGTAFSVMEWQNEPDWKQRMQRARGSSSGGRVASKVAPFALPLLLLFFWSKFFC